MRVLEYQNAPNWRAITARVARSVAKPFEDAEHPGIPLSVMYRAVKEITGNADLYHDEKRLANWLAETYWAEHPLSLDDLDGRMRYAAAGNLIDAGLEAHAEKIFQDFEKSVRQGLARDDRAKFFRLVPAPARILYLFDNAGEAVFDREVIKSLTHVGYRVDGIVRGGPILNDVTREDIPSLQLDAVLDSIGDTGSDAVGWDMANSPPVTKHLVDRADGFIIKGLANLETLSHHPMGKPALFIYRAKCPPSARLSGIAIHENAAWLQPRLGEQAGYFK